MGGISNFQIEDAFKKIGDEDPFRELCRGISFKLYE